MAELRKPLLVTLRMKLILGMMIVNAAIMLLFTLYLTQHQHRALRAVQRSQVEDLARNLAHAAAPWMSALDLAGLQELVVGLETNPQVAYAMLVDERGKVFAHTDPERRNQFVLDLPGPGNPLEVRDHGRILEAMVPCVLGSSHLGWARVGLRQDQVQAEMARITRFGLLFALFSTLLIAFLSAWLGRSLTKRLYIIRRVSSALVGGNRKVAIPPLGEDEIGDLGRDLNIMLSALKDGEAQVMALNRNLEAKVLERTIALAQSEAKFFKIFHSAPLMGSLTDFRDGRILEVNERYCQALGFTREELLGRTTRSLGIVSEGERLRLIGAVERLGTAQSIEFIVTRKDGGTIPTLFSGDLVEVGGQRLLITMLLDISDLKRGEHERHLLQAEVEHMRKLESLGQLAGGVAHDMNNVLAAILALASAHLTLEDEGTTLHRTFQTIRDASVRGGDMVKRLLAFARQSPSERHDLDLNALLTEEVRLLERTTFAKVKLELDLAPDLRPVNGDGSALAHAIMNVCVNAVDAMGGGGTLRFRTRNLDGGRVEMVVEDTGCGMTPEVLAKALDPFFTTKEVGKGTGLGLSLVFTTVKAHGGVLDIHSEPGRGTRVGMVFPASAGRSPGPEPAALAGSGTEDRPLEILLVDDDDLVQQSTRTLVGILGHALTSAVRGEAALALMEDGYRPDVVILDMNMPGLGGKGTLPRLRELCPAVPVLLATGRADQDALDLVAAHPFVTLLPKPFSIEELRRHLARGGPAVS